MFCTRCGTRNLDTDQFCRSCNAPLIKSGAQQSQGASSEPSQPQYPYSTPGAGQQQPPQAHPPYPGYQGYPNPQASYSNQMSGQQGGASGRAIAALIVSIVSLVMCCWPAGIVGAVLGKMEMNAIQEGRAPQAGDTMAKVGFYLGIAATAISLLFTALYFLGALASFAGGGGYR